MELWRDIPNYEGLYQVSNYGQVKSLKQRKEKLLKQAKEKNGYYSVSLNKDGNSETNTIHRLVAKAFIENPNNYPCVNHKDGNKGNNCVDNLEWVNHSKNMKHAYKTRLTQGPIKRVNQYDLEGNYIKTWKSITEARQELNIGFHISDVCNGKRNHAGGYIWRYVEEELGDK